MTTARPIFSAVLFLVLLTVSGFAQSRAYIRDAIKEWGQCKTVAITDKAGDIAVYGSNGYAYAGEIPEELMKSIKELNEKNEEITDISLTEGGRWVVLYGDNGMVYSGVSTELEKEMSSYNSRGDRITSVALNDEGDWIIISKEYYTVSDGDLKGFVADGVEKYGALYAAHLTDDGLVLVYEKGFKFLGTVPSELTDILSKETKDVYRVKFTSAGHYFISDRKGWYRYKM